MLKILVPGISALSLLASGSVAQTQDGPIVTGNRSGETADALKTREAIAYARPLPRGAPSADYPLVAWCDALVSGHADLGDTLPARAPEDVELVRLGRLEAQDFRTAFRGGANMRRAASARTSPRRPPRWKASASTRRLGVRSGIWWIGSRMNRSDSEVQSLARCS